MTYVISVGGDPLNPNPYTYSQISMMGNISLVWPSNTVDSTYTATDWVDITSSAAYTVTMPPANEAGIGSEVVFNNYGSFTITVNDSMGGGITTVASGLTKRVWITDNSTTSGSWRIANIGSGTTTADASMLAGYGLIAQSGLLSQSMQVSAFSTNATLNAGYRSYLANWTGGVGTLTLTNPATLGNNWFTNIKNSGSGILTLGGGYTIDGSVNASVSPNEGFTLATDGVTFKTLGRITPTTSSFTLISKSVAGSSDVTLTATEASYSIIYLTGVLTGNINVIVPASVNEWIIFNNTTGAYTLAIKTASGSGVAIVQATRRLLNCDGTDVNYSDTVGTGTVTSIATGTGLTGGPITTSGTISLANTAVSAGAYTLSNINVDAQGRITSAASATSGILQALQTPTSAGSTLVLQAYDVDGASYTTMATLTAGNMPTMDLNTTVTIGSGYIYRVGGTDIAVSDGGTGLSALTANNLIIGNGVSTPNFLAPNTSGNVATSNGTTWVSTASNSYTATPANPIGTASPAGVMMGIAGSITPIGSGKILVVISGDFQQTNGGDGAKWQIRHGTGSAPANGDALTGTAVGNIPESTAANNGFNYAIPCLNVIISGLSIGVAHWLDVSLAAITGGTATLSNIGISAYEIR